MTVFSQIACAYKLTAVGARPVASLQAAMAVVPIDLTLPNLYGMLYVGDATVLSGQTVTRTLRFTLEPSSSAIGSTTLVPGDTSGSPLQSIVLQSPGDGFARAPLVSIVGGAPDRVARARARMQLGQPLIVRAGSGYTGSEAVIFTGGELWPGGVQATGHLTFSGGAVTALIVDSQGGPYGIPPTITISPSAGSGAIITCPLSVATLELLDVGQGYPGSLDSPPAVTFESVFKSFFPDASNNAASSLSEFMRAGFQYALQTPVLASLPVVS